MKKTILASSLAVALGVTGYAATADNNQAHASEESIDKAHLAELAQSNAAELNEKPLHAGAYNYDFVLGGYEYTFTSDGQSWSWEYDVAGAQTASSNVSTNTTQDVSTQATTNTNETSASEVSTQQQSNNVDVKPVAAPKASTTTKVETTQTSTTSTTTTNTSSIDSVAQQMAERTGVSAAQWKGVIQRESGGNANAVNASSGAYGLFQLLGHGEHAGMSVEAQMDAAEEVYNSQGAGAWVAW
ncbi:transglycosylase family protein [Staphylococcus equorum]|uniref:transglycosylase family protein n=1 Tax=Staphylococcus equorum TaxID=246432 RepID=UPI0008062523|nr:transglycosylase family protein [Staphylococcus equorum]ANQ65211.1 transglycosylase [Staphylococcus equorum]